MDGVGGGRPLPPRRRRGGAAGPFHAAASRKDSLPSRNRALYRATGSRPTHPAIHPLSPPFSPAEAFMHPRFDPYTRSYASLSVRDLLEARDAYHVHLCHLDNVFATAVGRYLIRKGDPDQGHFVPAEAAKRGTRGADEPRTLENSVARPWSWPCVLVFVHEWATPEEIHASRGHVVPPFLYLPDGRIVPTCVVKATAYDGAALGPRGSQFASGVLGGGYPVLTDVQKHERTGSIGCLVTDGRRYYALTSQHVAGEAGSTLYTRIGGERRPIGTASARTLTKLPFEQAYAGLPGARTLSNLDVGLIDVADSRAWTAQVYGLGRLGPLFSFDASTATLDWVGCKVTAYGAMSGRLMGEVKALFYRYRTLGGTDYVSDFVISGRNGGLLPTSHGDSGTLWCVDPEMLPARADRDEDFYRPLAIQWGGQKLTADGRTFTQYALATSAAVACRELDVDIVTDLRADLPQYWGEVGHYKIAELAIRYLKSGALAAFMGDNLAQVTYAGADLETEPGPDPTGFVPLADVPDVVWKRDKKNRAQENWTHYADLDMPGADGRTTLSGLCGTPPCLVLDDWIAYYDGVKTTRADGTSREVNNGSLPFRVWQIFDAMAAARRAGSQDEFLLAAGILAHYVGDACQPLHGSMHADGLDGTRTGVHASYEEHMINDAAAVIRQKLAEAPAFRDRLRKVATGHDAGAACVELMRRSAGRIAPRELCEFYDARGRHDTAAVRKEMWDRFGEATLACLADGARTLAHLWEAAYATGRKRFRGAVSREVLKRLYDDPAHLVSLHLANLPKAAYVAPCAPAAAGAPRARSRARRA
jgi:hypothetical protein